MEAWYQAKVNEHFEQYTRLIDEGKIKEALLEFKEMNNYKVILKNQQR